MVIESIIEEGPKDVESFLEEVADASLRKQVIVKGITYLKEVRDGRAGHTTSTF